MTPDTLELGHDCQLEYCESVGATLCYKEHQADYWYSDTETEVSIDDDMARAIVAWLTEKCRLAQDAPETKGN